MKAKKRAKYLPSRPPGSVLKEGPAAAETQADPMIRTQIYLSKEEHDFISAEARRLDKPMAAVIRSFIDAKMEIPEEAWINNPMLRPFPPDPAWKGNDDGAINHDHYLHGAPKSWIRQNGKWVEPPPLPDDYFDNPASAKAYDAMVAQMERKEKRKAVRE